MVAVIGVIYFFLKKFMMPGCLGLLLLLAVVFIFLAAGASVTYSKTLSAVPNCGGNEHEPREIHNMVALRNKNNFITCQEAQSRTFAPKACKAKCDANYRVRTILQFRISFYVPKFKVCVCVRKITSNLGCFMTFCDKF